VNAPVALLFWLQVKILGSECQTNGAYSKRAKQATKTDSLTFWLNTALTPSKYRFKSGDPFSFISLKETNHPHFYASTTPGLVVMSFGDI
jgi:hypothetical protein